MTLHEFLDFHYGPNGDDKLRQMLQNGVDVNQTAGPLAETPLHFAVRRRRLHATDILLKHGAEINARTAGGKTAYAHAIRRGFDEVAALLEQQGANTDLNPADKLAVALGKGRIAESRRIIAEHPAAARSGNPEEDRLLADLAGREESLPVVLLIDSGADLTARGLDDGTPLHQAAWFGQPQNARLLIDAGAPLEIFDAVHHSSPLGWAVHGSRYSGGADSRQEAYTAIVRMLLDAGAAMHYPDDAGDEKYRQRLLNDASPAVVEILRQYPEH